MVKKILIATRNAHKVEEIRTILGPGYEFCTMADLLNPPQVVEDAHTFVGNATKKAVELARFLGKSAHITAGPDYVLADDSGLEVDALNGAPGVHSARFAAIDSGVDGNSRDTDNNAKLIRLLRKVPEASRTARFRCVIALTPVSGILAATAEHTARTASPACAADELEFQTEIFDGTCEGRISFQPSGGGGFGYDPLFIPTGFDKSFAELGEDIKNRISHRACALENLRARLTGRE